MTAPVIELPLSRLVAMPVLSRARRRTELERLCEDCTLGVPPSATAMRVLLAAYASDRLSPAAIDARWADFISEAMRLQAVEAGEPEFRDLQPGLAQQDCTAALNDLLDGTDTYRGMR